MNDTTTNAARPETTTEPDAYTLSVDKILAAAETDDRPEVEPVTVTLSRAEFNTIIAHLPINPEPDNDRPTFRRALAALASASDKADRRTARKADIAERTARILAGDKARLEALAETECDGKCLGCDSPLRSTCGYDDEMSKAEPEVDFPADPRARATRRTVEDFAEAVEASEAAEAEFNAEQAEFASKAAAAAKVRKEIARRFTIAETVGGAALAIYNLIVSLATDLGQSASEVGLNKPGEGRWNNCFEITWEGGPFEWACYFADCGRMDSYSNEGGVIDPRSNPNVHLEPGYSFSICVTDA